MNSKYLSLVPLVLAGAHSAFACDICSVFAASEAQGSSGKGFFGGVAEQFTYLHTLQSQGYTVANDGEHMVSLTSQVFGGYNFNSHFSLQLNMPIIYREYHRTYLSPDDPANPGGYSPATRREIGPGDVSLIGTYRAYDYLSEKFNFSWNVLGGLKLPTGDASYLNPDVEDFSKGLGGHDLTLGSGSVDGIVGTGIFARYKKLFINASVQYAIRSAGAYGYRFANDLTWSGGPGVYLMLGHQYTLSLQGIISGEYKGEDDTPAGRTSDTAETIVYGGPQINFTYGSRISIQAGADVPINIYTGGNPVGTDNDQLVPNYRIHAAITYRF